MVSPKSSFDLSTTHCTPFFHTKKQDFFPAQELLGRDRAFAQRSHRHEAGPAYKA